MNKLFIVVIFLIFIFLSLNGQHVNGDTIRVSDNTIILKVWGNHYERGYAHGYLLGDKIKLIFEEYVLKSIFGNNSTFYNYYRSYFISNFQVDDKYCIEASAMISGMEDAGISIFCAVLNRDVDSIDILMVNTIDEMRELDECSSLSSWGASTVNDTLLSGDLVITRLMDWQLHYSLVENHLVLVNIPSENDEQNWITVTYPGLFAALSAVNESGIGAFKNVGNYQNHPNIVTFHPVLLSVRNGIERDDYNNDGFNNTLDVADAVDDDVQFGSSVIHVVSSVMTDSFSFVIECNNENGFTKRNVSDNSVISGDNIAATNHHRKLYSPVGCVRYDDIVDSLNSSTEISSERSWNIMAGAGGYATNNQMMQFIPGAGILKLATATVDSPAYMREVYVFDINDLFILTSVEEEPAIVLDRDKIYMKITSQSNCYSYTIDLVIHEQSYLNLNVYNISGQLISTLHEGNVSSGEHQFQWTSDEISLGLYFCRADIQTNTGFQSIVIRKFMKIN